MEKTPLQRAFEKLGGPSGVARTLSNAGISITPWAVNKWLRAGRLPRTDYSGETRYAEVIASATDGEISADELLGIGRRLSQVAG